MRLEYDFRHGNINFFLNLEQTKKLTQNNNIPLLSTKKPQNNKFLTNFSFNKNFLNQQQQTTTNTNNKNNNSILVQKPRRQRTHFSSQQVS